MYMVVESLEHAQERNATGPLAEIVGYGGPAQMVQKWSRQAV
jgi:3-oxoacyl-(acyl-carrier-protein) synthase